MIKYIFDIPILSEHWYPQIFFKLSFCTIVDCAIDKKEYGLCTIVIAEFAARGVHVYDEVAMFTFMACHLKIENIYMSLVAFPNRRRLLVVLFDPNYRPKHILHRALNVILIAVKCDGSFVYRSVFF